MLDGDFLKKYNVKNVDTFCNSFSSIRVVITFLDGHVIRFEDNSHDMLIFFKTCEDKIMDYNYLCKIKLRKKKIIKIKSKL